MPRRECAGKHRGHLTRAPQSHALKIFFVLSLWISVAGGLLTWTLGSGDSVHVRGSVPARRDVPAAS